MGYRSSIKKQTVFAVEKISQKGGGRHRVVLEIGVTLTPPLITLSMYGHDVPLKVSELTGMTVPLFLIKSAIRLVVAMSWATNFGK